MDKKKLRQYRALIKEQELNDKAIDKLYDRLENVPVVAGKVVGSSCNFPYTEVRTTVQMTEPVETDEINRRIKIREERQKKICETVLEIEEFIAEISDSQHRQIFEYLFLGDKKMSQRKIGEAVGCDQATVSRIMKKYLKDA